MEAAERPAGEIVVASYNVHGFVGLDERFDPARSCRVIEALDADLVALQEMHDPAGEPRARDALEALSQKSGYRLLLGPTLKRRGGDFGNALLTRLPVDAWQGHDLSVPGREPRGALDVRLELDGVGLRAIAVHLGLRAGERRAQIAQLAERIDEGDGPRSLLGTVLLGDFNEWGFGRRRLAPLARRVGSFTRISTFPARRPFVALDRIAVRPEGTLVSASAMTSPLARVASDHLPLRARLRLPPPPATS